MTESGGSGGADLDEIETVYRARFAEFLRVAAAIVGDVDLAHDAVQDGFASAIRNRLAFRRRGPLEAWLWRAVVNAARARRRAEARPARAAGHEAALSANGREPGDDELRRRISLLPERQRLALFLRYYADLDYATIAAVLDVRPGTVAATLNAAHAALRRSLEEVSP